MFVASLHQAITEELPTRLDFYEHWLNREGLQGGTIGLAPMMAVLSFLRQEGDAYNRVVGRAGTLAATWHADGVSGTRRSIVEALPRWLRIRATARMARGLIRAADSASSGRVTFRRGEGRLVVRSSLFCELRETGTARLCEFYAAAVETLMHRFGVQGAARVAACRAAGEDECVIIITAAARPSDEVSRPE